MQILTVSELTTYLRELLAADDVLRDVWVEGEVSGFNRHSSGHCYFTLKEQNAQLAAVCFRRDAERLAGLPAHGDRVYAHGYVTFYDGGGKLQIVVDQIRPAGIGLLNARFEELKARLGAEGLFDAGRKRPLPSLPRRIGVATSPSGAALRDILTVLRRRFALAEVLLAPCVVQGDQAPDSIVEALYGLYEAGVDVIILARGGGSAEDLSCFNDEAVARAVFASPVPLITGVGHETDTTIVDYVADVRAPTPSVAAELSVPDAAELAEEVALLRRQLDTAMSDELWRRREELAQLDRSLRQRSPIGRLTHDRQQIDDLLRRMGLRFEALAALQQARLQGLRAQLKALSPLATLERGYAVVRRADGTVITAPEQVAHGDSLDVTVREGRFDVVVDRPEGL
jgi:exodeoxyribonuclease VII large subunit